LLAEIYTHLKSFDLWGNNSIANFSLSGNTGSFTPGFWTESGGQLIGMDDPVWQVQFGFDDQNDVVTARTLGGHPLIGVRKWYASSSSQNGNCTINITTEAYDKVRNLGNLILSPGGNNAQLQIWRDYFNNLSANYEKNSCFQSKKVNEDKTTYSKSNPWLQ
jgi:hypothetical protein